jgi:hypothetical protein
MDNIIEFPGKTILDVEPDKVLDAAIGKLETVLVIGLSENSEYYFATSTSDKAKLLLMLETFKFKLLAR